MATEKTAPEPVEDPKPDWLAMPDELTVHQRMLAVLAELPAIGKGQYNEQQKFAFRGHDDVMDALNPLLAKWGVLVVPEVVERWTGERTTSRGSTMYEVSLHVRYTFYGAAGDTVEASAIGEGTDMGDKSTSKAMTMAFKAVLAQAFAISTSEFSDPDGQSAEETTRGGSRPSGGRGQREPRPQWEGPKNWSEIMEWGNAYGESLGWREWVGDAAMVLYAERSSAALTAEQRAELGQRAAAAIVALRKAHPVEQFPPPTRSEVQDVWSPLLGNVALPGPSWQMSPEETDRPPFVSPAAAEQAAAEIDATRPSRQDAPEGAQEGAGAAGADPDDIPFGEPSA